MLLRKGPKSDNTKHFRFKYHFRSEFLLGKLSLNLAYKELKFWLDLKGDLSKLQFNIII